MRVDYHMHSHTSHDARGRIEEHVRRAEEIGLDEICFTEHLDFYPSQDGLACPTIPTDAQLESYLQEVREAQRPGGVRVRAGIELDYKPEADRWVRELLGRFAFDFALGAVHNVGAWPVSGPRETALAFFEEKGPEQGCLDYFAVVEQAIATGLFDSFAHLDLMKRFRPENAVLMMEGRLKDQVVAILDLMAARGTGIEINCSGLTHDPGEAYPSLDLLRLARGRGVEILTLGSDSHRPETVGRHLDAGYALALDAGYTHLHTFDGRAPSAHPIYGVS